jgi:hypothetical protein
MVCSGVNFTLSFFSATYIVDVLALRVSDVLNACEFGCCFEDWNEHLGLTKCETFLAV